MTRRREPIGPVPDETARIARAAFPKGNTSMGMRDVLGTIYDDARFADLFVNRGPPVESPWRLALVTVMQFAEGLSDRQAAEAVRARIDWKYALGLDLADPGFDCSVLSAFRTRLVKGSAEDLLLDALLGACKAHGYLKSRGRQRTDATHALAALRVLNRLERVAETLRAALDVPAEAAPDWLQALSPPEWFERYGRRIEDDRLPKGREARDACVEQVGADGMRVLAAVFSPQAPPALRDLPAVEILRRTWVQQFALADDPVRLRAPKGMPAASVHLESPYETDARFGAKRETEWTGYKVHRTETCDDDLPHLLTQVETTVAPVSDMVALDAVQGKLARIGLRPAQHPVDAGYVRAPNLVASRDTHRIDLVGPIYEDRQWQAKAGEGSDGARFRVDWERRVVTCPEGRESVSWSEMTTARGRAMVGIHFAAADCRGRPARSKCTRAKTGYRSLLLQAREEHEAIPEARRRQGTAAFKAAYGRRAGIEGTPSPGVRAFGLRTARYRGLKRTHLQHVATAAAINVGRLAAWLNGIVPISSRRSRFAALAPAC